MPKKPAISIKTAETPRRMKRIIAPRNMIEPVMRLPGEQATSGCSQVFRSCFGPVLLLLRYAGAGRFLGRVVRPVPHDRPVARGHRQGDGRQAQGSEGQHTL